MTSAAFSITDTEPVIQYAALAGQTAFAYPFVITDQAELKVSVDQVEQTLGTDYTVAGVGDEGGGTVTFTSAPGAGASVTLWLDMEFQRLTGFSDGAATLMGSALNDEFIASLRRQKQLRMEIRNALRLAPDDPQGGQDMEIPSQATRLNRFLAFDANGKPIASSGTGNDTALRDDLADADTAGVGHNLVAVTKNQAERDAGLTIVNGHLPIGDVRRWGDIKWDGVTDDLAGLLDAIEAAHLYRVQSGQLSFSLRFPPGIGVISAGIPWVNRLNYIGDQTWGTSIKCTGSTAAIFSATYAAGVFTDNLDDTLNETSVTNCALRFLHLDHTGTISGNAGSGTAWDAVLQLVNVHHPQLDYIRVSSVTDDTHGAHLKFCYGARIKEYRTARGGANSGGNGLYLDSTSNAVLVTQPFIFGAWDQGIRSTNPESVTIVEPNIEFATIGIWAAGKFPRIIGGYFEGNGTDIRLGTIGGTAATDWLIQRPILNGGTGAEYAIDLANAQGGHADIGAVAAGAGAYGTKRFRQRTKANGNFGNLIQLRVADAAAPGLAALGLDQGENVVEVIGTDHQNHRAWKRYTTVDQAEAETELNQRGFAYQSFVIDIENDGGTIKHSIHQGDGSTAATYASKIEGASPTPVATPTVDSVTDFANGAGLVSGALHRLVLDVAESQEPVGEFNLAPAIHRNTSGTAVTVSTQPLSSDINGTTIFRPDLTFRNAATGAAFDLTTLAAGEVIEVRLTGFIR